MAENEKPMRRREGDQIASVFGQKFGDHLLALVFGVLLAVCVAVPTAIWSGSRWVARLELAIERVDERVAMAVTDMKTHVEIDDARTAQIAETMVQFDKTMTRIVVNQEGLQQRVTRLEKNADETTINH